MSRRKRRNKRFSRREWVGDPYRPPPPTPLHSLAKEVNDLLEKERRDARSVLINERKRKLRNKRKKRQEKAA